MVQRAASYVMTFGLDEVDEALIDFPDATRKKLVYAATRQIMTKIMHEARAAAPMDQQGRIAAAMKIKPTRFRGRHGARLDVGKGLNKGRQDTFFAGFLEYGTPDRKTKKKGKSTGKIEVGKFEFLRPALYRNREYAVERFTEAVRAAISEAAEKATRKRRAFVRGLGFGVSRGPRAPKRTRLAGMAERMAEEVGID